MATAKVGRRGVIVIPSRIRERLGLIEGTLVIVEEQDGSVVIRPAVALPVDVYAARRKAQELLNNARDAEDYARICKKVKRMGFDRAIRVR